jgi:hypothetical protein
MVYEVLIRSFMEKEAEKFRFEIKGYKYMVKRKYFTVYVCHA